MAFVSGYVPGYNTSVVSIAPSQTAAIASFSRIWAQIASSLAPYEIGALTKQVLYPGPLLNPWIYSADNNALGNAARMAYCVPHHSDHLRDHWSVLPRVRIR
ncbi:hypothetical protein ANCDUO_10467 [Ancylostoma duodenale]|uniref:Uncharacterized protein n=1 Tax=Ancylostoma duodenale TaxID=51022 RepID=A0A0C2GQQ3_9BILA|nr:hypothetical protein ANCDUO_10467 [Ancylostoma duodenale]